MSMRMHQVDDKHDDNVNACWMMMMTSPLDLYISLSRSHYPSFSMSGFYGNAKYVKDAPNLTADS